MTEGEESLSELGKAALSYVRSGFAVFPLRPGGKEPRTKNGLNDWTDDEESVVEVWSAFPDSNVGIVCGSPSGGLLAIDVDCHEDGEDGYASLREFERENGKLPDTCSQITGSGGMQMLYRSDVEVRNGVNTGIGIDVRGDGGYIVAPPSVHPNGKCYEWENPPDEMAPQQADEAVLALVRHVGGRVGSEDASKWTPHELPDEVREGGRNDALFRAGASMRAKRVEPSVIADALRGINAQRFRPPLDEREVEKVVESVLALPEGHSEAYDRSRADKCAGCDGCGEGEAVEVAAATPDAWVPPPPPLDCVNDKGRPIHNKFGRYLIERHMMCKVGTHDGAPAIWTGRCYSLGWDSVHRAITRACDSVKASERKEIGEYVRLMAPVREEAPSNLVAFRNGVLDIETDEFRPMGPDVLITNVIPHDYDAGIVDEPEFKLVSDKLFQMADGDEMTFLNLMEAAGMCIYRSNSLQKCPVLLGEGSNGKSVFLRMVESMLGFENYSVLELNQLDKNFQMGQLAGKLANISDDISNEFLKGNTLALFKKVSSGEQVFTDVKNLQGYKFRPYCTMMFSANEFPRIEDSSYGMMRRLHPIVFSHRFSKDDEDFDPRITEKLTTEKASQALAIMAVSGLKNAIEMNGFSPNAKSMAAVASIKEDNDTVVQWIADEAMGAEKVDGQPVAGMYERYSKWCDGSGCSHVSRNKFTKSVSAAMGVSVKSKWIENAGKSGRCFVVPQQ